MKVQHAGRQIDLAAMVREIMQPDRLPAYDPWFVQYHGWLRDDVKLDNYLRYLQTLLAQAGVGSSPAAGARILDAGCGFGLTSLFLNLLGAAEVHGLDCHAGMIRTFQTYLDALPFPHRTSAQLGDVAQLPYPDAHFDLVLSIEAISHYREVERFLSEAARVLRPGGTLIVADGNNQRHRPTLVKTRQIWAAFEDGPATEDIHGHRVEQPFVVVRRDMIAGAFPALSAPALDDLARQTSGLWGDQVVAAARRYVERGEMPGRRWDGVSCPLDPRHGYYIEYLLDPLELARHMGRHGLRAWVRPYFGGARGGLLQRVNAVLSWPPFAPLALSLTSSFRAFGVKRERPQGEAACASPS